MTSSEASTSLAEGGSAVSCLASRWGPWCVGGFVLPHALKQGEKPPAVLAPSNPPNVKPQDPTVYNCLLFDTNMKWRVLFVYNHKAHQLLRNSKTGCPVFWAPIRGMGEGPSFGSNAPSAYPPRRTTRTGPILKKRGCPEHYQIRVQS